MKVGAIQKFLMKCRSIRNFSNESRYNTNVSNEMSGLLERFLMKVGSIQKFLMKSRFIRHFCNKSRCAEEGEMDGVVPGGEMGVLRGFPSKGSQREMNGGFRG
jgi:hypothetical protein